MKQPARRRDMNRSSVMASARSGSIDSALVSLRHFSQDYLSRINLSTALVVFCHQSVELCTMKKAVKDLSCEVSHLKNQISSLTSCGNFHLTISPQPSPTLRVALITKAQFVTADVSGSMRVASLILFLSLSTQLLMSETYCPESTLSPLLFP